VPGRVDPEARVLPLTREGAHLYLTTSQIALACGVFSWDRYLLRLRCVKDCVEKGTVEERVALDILRREEFVGDDEWSTEEPGQRSGDEVREESEMSISNGGVPFESPRLRFLPAGGIGLHEQKFHQYDADFFPSIPHGH